LCYNIHIYVILSGYDGSVRMTPLDIELTQVYSVTYYDTIAEGTRK